MHSKASAVTGGRDEAFKRVIPEYDAAKGYKAKIVLPQNLLDEDTLNVFSVVVITPEGTEIVKALPPAEFSADCCCFEFQTTHPHVDGLLSRQNFGITHFSGLETRTSMIRVFL